ncbi:MAG: hypothetical protein WCG07_01655 [Candidatus Taylorbacteria bacterium]
MKAKIMSVLLVSAIILLAGCDPGPLPVRNEAFTNEFHVVNFVSTNKIFIANEQGTILRMTAVSTSVFTNGQTVSGEAVIRGYAPGGVIEQIIVYPKQ